MEIRLLGNVIQHLHCDGWYLIIVNWVIQAQLYTNLENNLTKQHVK
jgi:hypothetical protein